MIKINLALMKQSPSVSGASKKMKFNLKAIDLSQLKELPLAQLVIAAIIAYGAQMYYEDQKQIDLDQLATQLKKANDEKSKISADLAKTKDFEKIKAQLENDQKTLSIKLQTIQKLIDGRQSSYRFLVSLSESIPKEVWLDSFKFSPESLTFGGRATEYNHVSEFMKNLKNLPDIQDISLKNTKIENPSASAPASGLQPSAKQAFASFSIEGKRK